MADVNEVWPFFVGCPRSGTTLIRVMFDCHPRLSIPRESKFIVELGKQRERYERAGGFDSERLLADLKQHDKYKRWRFPEDAARRALFDPLPTSYPDAIRALFAEHARLEKKPLYGDKTPGYCLELPLLAEMFPEGRFVHVVRDGRNVALSLLESPFGPDRIDRGAIFWRQRVLAAKEAGAILGPDRYFEYRHEDLVADPPGVLKQICAFLDLEYTDALLTYYESRPSPSEEFFKKFPHVRNITKPPTTTRSWRDQMSDEDVAIFEQLAGDVLEAYGYERATSAGVLPPDERKRINRRARAAQTRERIRSLPLYQRLLHTRPGQLAMRLVKRPGK